ncbi:MAG: two-component system response regulator [Desulfobacterium sp.]|nr:two-component system response regulator [Desulfobacterium sp.]
MKLLKNCKILIVDDTKTNTDILVKALKNDYRLSVAINGKKAIEYIKNNRVDLILLDILMPEMDGFEVCKRLKADTATRDIPIVFITAMDDPVHKTLGFEAGAVDYITKPFDAMEVKARVKNHLTLKIAQEALKNQNLILDEKVKERTRELEETQIEVIDRLVMAAEYRDEETGNHIRRMSKYCEIMGRAAGLSARECEILSMASTMHDIGKIGIPDVILLKPGKLTSNEMEIMKTHTTIGSRLLAGSESVLLQTAEVIARTHHENWDGRGYPRGLKEDEIPLPGRIGCICDVFDALISERPYKRPWALDLAIAEINAGLGVQFDPDLVIIFNDRVDDFIKIVERWS